jgi:hypothetical protein
VGVEAYLQSFLTNAQHGGREIPGDVLPWKQLPVPIMWDAGWITGPVRRNWRRSEIPGIEQLLVGSPASGLVTLKANSHIPCRSHAIPLPCRAANGLDCVFPI